jgi:purine-binding chemotaxis protein CheW
MNLAEIRKKAQRTVIPTVPSERAPEDDMPSMDEVFANETLGYEAEVTLPDDVTELSSCEEIVAPLAGFDPLAMILAGREGLDGPGRESAEPGKDTLTAGERIKEFLCFRVSDELYAISIMEIKEIIKPREITEVPRVPSFVSGILSLRGTIIPVFNMRMRLGLPASTAAAKERILVVRKGEEFCGLIVDEVIQVVRIPVDTIEEPPGVLDGVDRDFVEGIGRRNGMMLILLNLHTILDINLH